jgi:3'(2'), 5'-bisphosphate nucleotidase
MTTMEPQTVDLRTASRDAVATVLAEAALAAGPAVMDVYSCGCVAEIKSDGSPVTVADQRAEEIICAFLRRAGCPFPIVAEEAACAGQSPAAADRFLLIDPLDGTREFLAHNGEFTINVALVENGVPVAGAVYAPALSRLWVGGAHAFVCDCPPGAPLPGEAQRQPISARIAPPSLIAVASRSHSDPQTEAFLTALPIAERRSRGSSLKFCLVAEGLADVYPRFGPTMEWDTAAGHAVLRAAGGLVLDGAGAPFAYGKAASGLRNGPFIAWGDPAAAARFGHR